MSDSKETIRDIILDLRMPLRLFDSCEVERGLGGRESVTSEPRSRIAERALTLLGSVQSKRRPGIQAGALVVVAWESLGSLGTPLRIAAVETELQGLCSKYPEEILRGVRRTISEFAEELRDMKVLIRTLSSSSPSEAHYHNVAVRMLPHIQAGLTKFRPLWRLEVLDASTLRDVLLPEESEPVPAGFTAGIDAFCDGEE